MSSILSINPKISKILYTIFTQSLDSKYKKSERDEYTFGNLIGNTDGTYHNIILPSPSKPCIPKPIWPRY